jgi:hypothetical protein
VDFLLFFFTFLSTFFLCIRPVSAIIVREVVKFQANYDNKGTSLTLILFGAHILYFWIGFSLDLRIFFVTTLSK